MHPEALRVPSDYEAILESNLHEYGHATRHLDLLRDLHPDRTHFIYELLQNADDAGASWIEFSVAPDELVVTHDGRPFNEADVRGITGIAAGTKADDLTKIGKFGVGFKSVYAYTTRPEVHSKDEHFAIELFIRPSAVPARAGIAHGITLFRFPLDRADAGDPAAEIIRALESLSPTTLLFLRHLGELRWVAWSGQSEIHRRTARPEDGAAEVSITVDRAGRLTAVDWLVLSKAIDLSIDGERVDERRVEIAFSLVRNDDASRRIQTVDDSCLVAFFPTQKETRLGFLVQGPYRTTPARDNVPPADLLNLRLIRETASLLKVSVRWLRDQGLLDAAALETLPLDPSVHAESSMFRPLFVATRDLLRDEPCIPADGGGFARGSEIALGPADLRGLLTPEILVELTAEESRRVWADARITSSRTPALAGLLRKECGAVELDAEQFLRQLSRPFLEARTDAWIIDFYRFLARHPLLVPRPYYMNAIKGKPIIRLEGGSQVEPFNARGEVAAFLPRADFEIDVPTVRGVIAQDESASAFLRSIGLRTPGLVDQVRRRILPKYADPRRDPDVDEVRRDTALVTAALAEAAATGGASLQTDVRQCAIVLARAAADGQVWLAKPAAAYFENPELRSYFDGNPRAWFVVDEPGFDHATLVGLGVQEGISLRQRATSWDGTVTLVNSWGYHERGLSGFDPDASIDGLDFALEHPTAGRSLFIWNELLSPVAGRLHGIVQSSGRQNYSFSSRDERSSLVATLATRKRWLPGPDGSWVAPSQIDLDDLPAEYARDEVLARALGMGATDLSAVSAALELPVEVLHKIERDAAFRRDVLDLYERRQAAASSPVLDEGAPQAVRLSAPVTIEAAISGRFDGPFTDAAESDWSGRTPEPRVPGDAPAAGPSPHRPAAHPVAQVIDLVPDDHGRRRLWEALVDAYGGECQVCGTGFRRRSGEPYFEIELLGSGLPPADRYRLGNALCLCPTCAAKLRYGSVHGLTVAAIRGVLQARNDGAAGQSHLPFTLCGDEVALNYAAEHLDDLRVMLEVRPDDNLEFEEEPGA